MIIPQLTAVAVKEKRDIASLTEGMNGLTDGMLADISCIFTLFAGIVANVLI